MINGVRFKQDKLLCSTKDSSFLQYGKVIEVCADQAVKYINSNAKLPDEGNLYKASDSGLEKLPIIDTFKTNIFGELSIQAGWCTGYNTKLNGMEWHKGSEVIIAATDLVLLLGLYKDIDNERYDSIKTNGYYIKKGEVIELFPMVLHYAPLRSGKYFKAGIILPKDTNLPLKNGINGVLRAKNKWLLLHPDDKSGIQRGGKIGIIGENIELIGYEKD